jgi:hypothetical protein
LSFAALFDIPRSGACPPQANFLYEQHRSVVPFPMWSALSPSCRLCEPEAKFLTLLFLRAMLSDPGRPSRILPSCRSLRIGFRRLKIVATAHAITRLNRLRRMRASLWSIEFPVYVSCGLFDAMSILPIHATLGTGGWLCLTRWRLSLQKKRQACSPHQKTAFCKLLKNLNLGCRKYAN